MISHWVNKKSGSHYKWICLTSLSSLPTPTYAFFCHFHPPFLLFGLFVFCLSCHPPRAWWHPSSLRASLSDVVAHSPPAPVSYSTGMLIILMFASVVLLKAYSPLLNVISSGSHPISHFITTLLLLRVWSLHQLSIRPQFPWAVSPFSNLASALSIRK